MSIESLISFVSPFIFTGFAIYFSLLLTKQNDKLKSPKVLYTWVAISAMYVLLPFVSFITGMLPFAAFIVPMIVIFVLAKFYWKLETNKAIVFALCYGAVNIISVVALGFLLAGVFLSPTPVIYH